MIKFFIAQHTKTTNSQHEMVGIKRRKENSNLKNLKELARQTGDEFFFRSSVFSSSSIDSTFFFFSSSVFIFYFFHSAFFTRFGRFLKRFKFLLNFIESFTLIFRLSPTIQKLIFILNELQ